MGLGESRVLVLLVVAIGVLGIAGCGGGGGGECGDGVRDEGEECDRDDLGSASCTSLGFGGGDLKCTLECTYDTRFCDDADPCGNGQIDTGEDCDGGELGGQTCAGLGFDGGELACSSSCNFDTTGCTGEPCGNGQIDTGEECDGANLGGETCRSLGYDEGTLDCQQTCRFDTSGCAGDPCGNGDVDPGEDCDGTDLDGATCDSLGFDGGTLSCSAYCTFNTSGCNSPCGNNRIDEGEECDGTDLGSHSCESLGFDGGELACNMMCILDTSGCTGDSCGNGEVDPLEDCDGTNLDGATCEGLGYTGGTLGCTAGCDFDTSGCTTPCGNGQIDDGEECDGQNFGGQSCQSLGYAGGELACDPILCQLDTSGCACDNEDAYEPNSTPETAAPIQPGFSEAALVVCFPGDQDWFQLELDGLTRYSFHAGFTHAQGDINMFLFPASDTSEPLAVGATMMDDENFDYLVPGTGAGSHLLLIERFLTYDIPTQTYALEVTAAGTVECVVDEDCPGGQSCVDNQCGQTLQGDSCSDPVVVASLPFSQTGVDISRYAPRFELESDACTTYPTGGRDVLYQVQLGGGQTLQASVTSTFDAALYIVSDCSVSPAPDEACLDGADDVAENATENVSHTASSAQTVYVVVDHYVDGGPSEGTFDISISSN